MKSNLGRAMGPPLGTGHPYSTPPHQPIEDEIESRKRTYDAWNRMRAARVREEALAAIESFKPEPHSPTTPAFSTLFPNNAEACSIHSLETLATFITDSTGQQSQIGATWRHELITTMNSGFGRGGLRSDGYKGVREGREHVDGRPQMRGVGRTGKAPAPVPRGMLDALGVPSEVPTTTETLSMTPEEIQASRQQAQQYGEKTLRELKRQRMSEDDIVSQIRVEMEKRGELNGSAEERLHELRADRMEFGDAILRELEWQIRSL